jgi:tetratricopeptide (TPR) repeat protein
MRKKLIIKYLLPLIIAFLIAVSFIALYSHYLLDSSLANLKVALKKAEQQKEIKGVGEIADILNDTYIAELTTGDFDLALAIKLEMSAQMLKDLPQATQKQNEQYASTLSAATNIEFAATIVQKASQKTQFKDAQQFIKTAINIKERAEKRPGWRSKIDDFVLGFLPAERKPRIKEIKNTIAKLQSNLTSYKGEKLQEKYLEIAKLYLVIKDWQNTQLNLRKSLEINSKNPTALKAKFFLAILYKQQNNFKEASAIFNDIKNSLPKEWKLFSAYQEADCAYKEGEVNKSAALFEEIFNTDSSSEIARLAQFRAGYIYLYDLKEPARAKAAFSKLSKESSLGIGLYAKEKMSLDISRRYCEEGFKLIRQGYISSLPEKYNEALNKFALAENIEPDYGVIYVGKALALAFLDKPGTALKEGQKAKTLAPDNPEVLANLGFIYYKFDMIEQSIAEFKRAVAVKVNSEIYHYNLGTLYVLKEDYDKAERHFRTALLLNPKYTYAYNNLAYVLLIKKIYSEAKERLLKAVALDPSCIDAHYNLGAMYYALGNYEEARKEFQQVEEFRPNFRKTQDYLAQIKEKLGY